MYKRQVLTGSLISALSLGLMLLVSRQLRVGLFELDALQEKLQDSRQQLKAAERERDKTLRLELAPLQKELTQLEAERERLSQDIASRDADIQRTEAELNSVRSRTVPVSRNSKNWNAIWSPCGVDRW